MSVLSDLITEDVVLVPLQSEDKPGALRELVSLLSEAGKIEDFEDSLKRIMDREDLQSTGIGNGLAIPHARMPSMDKAVAAMGISGTGIPFGSPDDKPVHIIFLLLGGASKPGEFLKALTAFAQFFSDGQLIGMIRTSRTPRDVVNVLANPGKGIREKS